MNGLERGNSAQSNVRAPCGDIPALTSALQRLTEDAGLRQRPAPEATIAVELLDPRSGRSIPGFTRDDAEPISTDNLRNIVRWKGGDRLPQEGYERVALRFWLECRDTSAKLYGFSFATP